MNLPAGIIYQEDSIANLSFNGRLLVKAQTMQDNNHQNSDWVCMEIPSFIDEDSVFEALYVDKISASMVSIYGRDGCFSDNTVYLVYEKQIWKL